MNSDKKELDVEMGWDKETASNRNDSGFVDPSLNITNLSSLTGVKGFDQFSPSHSISMIDEEKNPIEKSRIIQKHDLIYNILIQELYSHTNSNLENRQSIPYDHLLNFLDKRVKKFIYLLS